MRVYNLTDGVIIYRRRPIPSRGGSLEYSDLTTVPDRDRRLEEKKILAFGSLPKWYLEKQAAPTEVKAADKVVVADKVTISTESSKEDKQKSFKKG